MNFQLTSLNSSPTSATLLKDSSLDPLIYNLQSSVPPASREKVELTNALIGYGKRLDYPVPRYGLIRMLVLRTKITTADTTLLQQNPGFVFVKNAKLMSHSREIAQLNYIQNFAICNEFDKSVSDSLKRGALCDLDDIAFAVNTTAPSLTTTGDYYMYTPLFFAELMNPSLLDLSFIENLTVNLETCTSAELNKSGTAATIVADGSALIMYYMSPDESTIRKLQDVNYSIEKPLSIMSFSVYEESLITKSITAASYVYPATYFDLMKFNCPNLITCTRIVAYTGDGLLETVPISSAIFYMNGREVYRYTDSEYSLEQALFAGSSTRVVNRSSISSSALSSGGDNNNNMICHYWCSNPQDRRLYYSGAASGKNISNFSVLVQVSPFRAAGASTATTFKLAVTHETIQILSISGNSGKVSVSMSL